MVNGFGILEAFASSPLPFSERNEQIKRELKIHALR